MDDLRDWLKNVEDIGELQQVSGADWDLEIGALSDMNVKKGKNHALLFDNIKDYPAGFRVLTCSVSTRKRIELTLNLPGSQTDLGVTKVMREMIPRWEKESQNFPYQVVESGPVCENVQSGDDVNLFTFPVPKWHEQDGGRYIGTGDAVITQDPETGEVNLGTYRVMAHDRRTTGLYISPGKHGRIHYEKYHALGKACPVAMSFGHHPLINRWAGTEVPPGCEYPFIGAVQKAPVPVIKEEITGLPIPAKSEIVAVGWCPTDKVIAEGPFGEWTGYYASKERLAPIVNIERIYYRNDPIILGAPPGRPPSDGTLFNIIKSSALLWDALVKSGVPDVKAVWMSEAGYQQLVFISIKQRYPGHAKQAALLASQNRPAAYHGRYVIVFDDDIEVDDIQQVLWALCTRSDPANDIDIVRRAWSTPLDTMIRKPTNAYFNSRAIIDACKPFDWIDDFPSEIGIDRSLTEKVMHKWGMLFDH